MEIFNKHLSDIRIFINQKIGTNRTFHEYHKINYSWPASEINEIIFTEDTAVELGNPEKGSSSTLLLTQEIEKVPSRSITIIGPDIQESLNKSLPFAKLIISCIDDLTVDNVYEKYKKMEELNYDLSLKGFMVRAASNYNQVWCRINHKAFNEGLSLAHIGSEIIKAYDRLEFVKSTEVIFLTTSSEDINELKNISSEIKDSINGLNKIFNELDHECNTCDYTKLCNEVKELREIRNSKI